MEAGKRSLSAHPGAAVPSTGSGAGTASSGRPSQSSKGSLASPCSSLDPGVLASTAPIGPAELLHFTCSTHVAPGERFLCMLAMGCPWFDAGQTTALQQAAILVSSVSSRRIKSLKSLLPRLPMIRQPLRTNGTGNVNKNAAHSQTHVMGKRLHGHDSTDAISFSAPNSWWRAHLPDSPAHPSTYPCPRLYKSQYL